jgi:O-antigen/teichoic acid export membrane protein
MQATIPHKNPTAINGPWIVIGSAAVVGTLNYMNSLVLSRTMSPSDYGAYATFTSLFLIVGLVPNALQQQAAFAAAQNQTKTPIRPLLTSSLACTLTCLILAPVVSGWLHLPIIWMLGLALIAPAACGLGTMRGIAQGLDRTMQLGGNWLLEHGSKILLTLILWTVGGLFAAVTGLLASVLIAALAMHANRQSQIQLDQNQTNSSHTGSSHTGSSYTDSSQAKLSSLLGAAGLAQLAQTVIAHSDVLLAQALLSRVDAGIYVAINVALRSISMLGMAINTAMFAKLVQHGPTRPTLLVSSLPVLIGLALIILGSIAPHTLILKVLGEHDLPGTAWLLPACLAATCAAGSSVILNIRLARGKTDASTILMVGGLAQVIAIIAFHKNALEIASASAAAMLVTTLAMTTLHFLTPLKTTSSPDPRKEPPHVLQRL